MWDSMSSVEYISYEWDSLMREGKKGPGNQKLNAGKDLQQKGDYNLFLIVASRQPSLCNVWTVCFLTPPKIRKNLQEKL